jgi:hypothetical protein
MTAKANSIEVPLKFFSLISVGWNLIGVIGAQRAAVSGKS